MEFIQANIGNIIVLLAFILLVVFLLKKGKAQEVKQILFYLVIKAEELYGGGTGELKYATVVNWIYEKLPTILILIFSKNEINRMIEEAVTKMKDYLLNNEGKYIRDMYYEIKFGGK